MWKKIEEKILEINSATGIEVTFLSDEKISINTYTLKFKKNKPEKIIKHTNLNSFSELKTLPKNTPVTVVFTGKGILIKKTTTKVSEEEVLSIFLQEANPQEFYTDLSCFRELSIAAIARKTFIDEMLGEIKKLNLVILDFSLGFSALDNLLPYLKTDHNEKIHLNCYSVLVKDGQMTDFELNSKTKDNTPCLDEYLVGETYLQPFDILAYCAATNLLADNVKIAFKKNKLVQENREEFKYKRYLTALSFSILSFIFLLLLTNFLVFNHYFDLNNQLQIQQGINRKQLSDDQELRRRISAKEQFLEKAGWLKPTKTSFYADRFASFLPEGVWMTSMNFYPVSVSGLPFKKDTIQLAGYCDDPAQIHILINNIKTLEDIVNVTMKEYSFAKEEAKGNFSLEIVTK